MPPDFPLIPGSDKPVDASKAYRRRAIEARVRASQAVVDLLCGLAFGDAPERLHTPPLGPAWAADVMGVSP